MRGKTAEDIQLVELLDPVAEATGYEIVRLRLMGGTETRRLQIMAERPSDGDMNVEDCARLSRATYEGFEVKLELDRLAEGRKRFRGVLAGVDKDAVGGDQIGIDLEDEEATAMVPFAWVIEAKLVLNDKLMKMGADTRAARIASEQQQTTE